MKSLRELRTAFDGLRFVGHGHYEVTFRTFNTYTTVTVTNMVIVDRIKDEELSPSQKGELGLTEKQALSMCYGACMEKFSER